MLNKIGIACALLLSTMIGSSAYAGLIVDTIAVDKKVALSHSYTHDINDDGFVLGSALGGTIAVEIYDDAECDLFFCLDEVLPEVMLITIEDFDFDTGGISFGDFFGDLEINALLALNADGFLDVTVSSIGDFIIGDSVLTVRTADVPEPSILFLLSAGLVALGVSRKKQG